MSTICNLFVLLRIALGEEHICRMDIPLSTIIRPLTCQEIC